MSKSGSKALCFVLLLGVGFSLFSMEEGLQSSNVEHGQEADVASAENNNEQNISIKKKKKRKKKKKKKSEDKQNDYIDPATFDVEEWLNTLPKGSGNGNVRKLGALQLFANYLVFFARLYETFQELSPIIKTLRELQDYRFTEDKKTYIQGFCMLTAGSINKQGLYAMDGYGRYHLRAKSGQEIAAVLQVGPFLAGLSTSFNSDKIKVLDKILQYDNEKVKRVAGVVKHTLYSWDFTKKIKPLLVFSDHLQSGNGFDALFNMLKGDSLYNELLMKSDLQNHCKSLPYFSDFISHGYRLLQEWMSSCLPNEKSKEADLYSVVITDDMVELERAMTSMCGNIFRYKEQYSALYNKIKQEILMLTRSLSQHFNPAQRNCFNKLINDLFPQFEYFDEGADKKHGRSNSSITRALPQKICFKSPNQQDIRADDMSTSALSEEANDKGSRATNKKPQSHRKPAKKKNKNKKTMHKGAKEEEGKAPGCVEHEYDPRVDQWFDSNFANEYNFESVLYHSFSKKADKYIFDLGIQTDWENRMSQGQMDKNYSLGGEIHYDQGSRKIVVFTCCKDPNGVCYHRGYTEKENNRLFEEYFANHYWKVLHRDNFPELGTDIIKIPQPQDKKSDEICEDDFCVKIRDNRLNVSLVLFKPCMVDASQN